MSAVTKEILYDMYGSYRENCIRLCFRERPEFILVLTSWVCISTTFRLL